MFKFLKDKLKDAVTKFSKKAEEEGTEEEIVEEKEVELDEKAILEEEKKLEEKKKKKEKELKELEEKKKKEKEEKEAEEKKKKEKEEKEAEQKKEKEELEQKKKQEAEEQEQKELEKKKEEEQKAKELEEKKKKEEEEKKQKEAEEKAKEEQRKKEEEEKQKKLEEEKKKKEEELKKLEEEKEKLEEKKGFFSKLKEKFKKKEEPEEKEEEKEEPKKKKEEKKEKPKEEIKVEKEDKEITVEDVKETEKKGFLAKVKEKVTTKKISSKQFNDLFWDLELALLENNVAVEVIEKIKADLEQELVDNPIRKSAIEEKIIESLKKSIESLFETETIDLVEAVKSNKEKPYVVIFVGVNGSGKTTSIAKIAKLMQDNGLKPIIAASDTFRAAAIHQIEEHGKKLNVKVVKHDYGADPSAVAFDAIKAAKAHKLDVVLIDTAGRMHSNTNLQEEMKKIVRVTKPDLKIFVGEALTGNDAVIQSKAFDEAIDLNGIILTKSDIDEKGGAIVSISYVTGKPILYLGVGQDYDSLEKFDPKKIISKLGL